jgi:hypothetical protein
LRQEIVQVTACFVGFVSRKLHEWLGKRLEVSDRVEVRAALGIQEERRQARSDCG